MTEIQIELIFNRAVFEEVYFKDNQGNIFLSKNTKQHFFIFLSFTVALLILLIYCIRTNLYWIGFVVLIAVFLISAFNFFRTASAIMHWKRDVYTHLNELSKYQHYKVILTDAAISVIMDKVEKIEKWTAIKEANITEDFVSLISATNYLFPRKSMADKDYELLKAFVSERMKKGI